MGLKEIGANVLLKAFQYKSVNRLFDWMAEQRRRARRRQVEQRLREKGLYGNEVLFGPFKGMKYDEKWASSRFEKIIGAYEAELHPVIEKICAKPYSEVINVGCAEGYYTIGLALRIKTAMIYAYDIEEELLEHCRELAKLNGVGERVITRSFCDVAELNRINIRQKALIVSDCEGYEVELLNPEEAPILKKADILVELHEVKRKGVINIIENRFKNTHNIEHIQNEGLKYSNYPILRELTFPEIYAMIGEERIAIMDWFFMMPKDEK